MQKILNGLDIVLSLNCYADYSTKFTQVHSWWLDMEHDMWLQLVLGQGGRYNYSCVQRTTVNVL